MHISFIDNDTDNLLALAKAITVYAAK